jgi:hypothetical protein
MLANCCTKEAAVLDPKTLSWAPVGTGKADINDEEGWTLLPSGKVLTVDAFNGINSELFDPATSAWALAGTTVVQLVEPNSHELGPAVLRPDGTVFAIGATGHNAIYNTATGMWSAGPDFPKVNGIFLGYCRWSGGASSKWQRAGRRKPGGLRTRVSSSSMAPV